MSDFCGSRDEYQTTGRLTVPLQFLMLHLSLLLKNKTNFATVQPSKFGILAPFYVTIMIQVTVCLSITQCDVEVKLHEF